MFAVSWPAGPDRENEDAVVLRPGIGVVVDGAGLDASVRRGCVHSVAWYARSLAAAFGELLEDRRVAMTDALAEAIRIVTASHGDGCSLIGGSPSATVAAWRVDGDDVEHLVLCDASIVVLDADGGVEEITDRRIEEVVTRRTAEILAQTAGPRPPTPEEVWSTRFRALEETRNVRGGFWCAQADPAAAGEALTGRRRIGDGGAAAVLAASDGGTRGFQLVGAHDLASFAARAASGELEELAAEIRTGEERLRERGTFRGKPFDDLTIVVGSFVPPASLSSPHGGATPEPIA
ncbi:protein phosphatase 2C domain-containing protein [Microbacterium resistens]|uniref:protein phosphatase 2C domain-containing protein n=1 Tax=Microbacterium resistens TaxID=156977 RepID=UPI0008369A71|nr:protein phosphatase 2C domain-containing protein [Microbacterium resistens]